MKVPADTFTNHKIWMRTDKCTDFEVETTCCLIKQFNTHLANIYTTDSYTVK